ncbi:deoxyribose-phosphate aldolase [Actinomycetaceae bacterium WB03_NA08]|uniref:Deoxyribose-phosphate aldolase n=1 Tax=Scrofimicrobium canadense TaxID=2652290 RepID=A0A6N7W7Y9_9ACTO|nr:deoxyribose-phosphate aldolase [Scrofimicrobium canadense]MSS84248.1 deoxyribose-phosphate aldolase [Scrofimicrobium canadense]
MKKRDVAQMIDHTLLKPEATAEDVVALVDEAKQLGTYSVCVSPSLVPVTDTGDVKVACVVGFPSGAHPTASKIAEAAAVAPHVDEIDMVINLGLAKGGDWAGVESDIRAVREAAPETVLKVIIESAALTDDEIIKACQASESAGADFVKTSTGFHPAGGASEHAVKLMRETVGDRLGVKASGGIRTPEAAASMISAGASRLGLSSSAVILEGFDD